MPGAILDQAQGNPNLKTIDPEIPDFASRRNALHKFAGFGCNKKQYLRYFTVDQERKSLTYYKQEKDADFKKSLELKDSKAFIEARDDFYDTKKAGKSQSGDTWADPN